MRRRGRGAHRPRLGVARARRASTTSASSRPSRRTSRRPRAPPCPTSPRTRRSSCCRTACARSGSPAIVGDERVIGAIVAWGASMPEPGRYERTASGGFTIGRLSGVVDDDLRRVGELLEAIGPVDADREPARRAVEQARAQLRGLGARHDRGRAARAARPPAPLSPARARDDDRGRRGRARRGRAAREGRGHARPRVDRAHRRRSRARSCPAALTAKHALLLAVGLRYRRMRSSMLAAIERGRTPAIDFLNGEVVTRGKKHGIATPLNDKIVETVWAIAKGTRSRRARRSTRCAAPPWPNDASRSVHGSRAAPALAWGHATHRDRARPLRHRLQRRRDPQRPGVLDELARPGRIAVRGGVRRAADVDRRLVQRELRGRQLRVPDTFTFSGHTGCCVDRRAALEDTVYFAECN